jgi:drug/metabolite transporter (DMT)-like permease
MKICHVIVSMTYLGILLTVFQQTMFAGETALVRAMAGSLSVWQIIVMRSVGIFSLAFLLGQGLGSFRAFKTSQSRLLVFRWAIGVVYMFVFAYSFSNLPLADSTAISYSQTLYTTWFGYLILGEKATPMMWLTVLVGFGGSLLVAHPIGGDSSKMIIYLLIILGTSLNALFMVLGRLLQRQDSAASLMFYPSIATILLVTPMTVGDSWHPSWLWSGLLVLGPVGAWAGTYALRYATVAVLAPWLYTRLVVAAFVGIVVMREIPDRWTIAGLAMIILSCVMTTIFAGETHGHRSFRAAE